jgi:hypothetical protein
MQESDSPQSYLKFALAGLGFLALVLVGIAIYISLPPAESQPAEEARIRAAVAATLSALPTPSPMPAPTLPPAPTPISLDGLFCEYRFCIGHPADVYLVDASTIRNPASPSTYAYGILFGFNANLYIQVVWTTSGPTFDPQLTMRYILEEKEQTQGTLEAKLVDDINLYYQPITTISDKLPYGGVGAWQCNGRDFAWKAYAPNDGMIQPLLQQALQRFTCE